MTKRQTMAKLIEIKYGQFFQLEDEYVKLQLLENKNDQIVELINILHESMEGILNEISEIEKNYGFTKEEIDYIFSTVYLSR